MKNSNSFNKIYNNLFQEQGALSKVSLAAAEKQKQQDPDESLIADLIRHEGPIGYQTHKGSFKDGKFYSYKDKDGKTIGYGHFIKPGEDFSKGITPAQAKGLLSLDIRKAKKDASELLAQHGVESTPELHNIITQMTFQLGKQGANKFKKMWAGLKAKDYSTASKEMLDSKWNKQTPKRAKEMSDKMLNYKEPPKQPSKKPETYEQDMPIEDLISSLQECLNENSDLQEEQLRDLLGKAVKGLKKLNPFNRKEQEPESLESQYDKVRKAKMQYDLDRAAAQDKIDQADENEDSEELTARVAAPQRDNKNEQPNRKKREDQIVLDDIYAKYNEVQKQLVNYELMLHQLNDIVEKIEDIHFPGGLENAIGSQERRDDEIADAEHAIKMAKLARRKHNVEMGRNKRNRSNRRNRNQSNRRNRNIDNDNSFSFG